MGAKTTTAIKCNTTGYHDKVTREGAKRSIGAAGICVLCYLDCSGYVFVLPDFASACGKRSRRTTSMIV